MPRQTRNTIWVIGAEGSGKSTLITLLPIAALRIGWVLLPDEYTARHIYDWQHQLFSNGKFPPKGEAQRTSNFSFSHLKPEEWVMSQLRNGKLRIQRSITVVEHSIAAADGGLAIEEELTAQANINEEFGVVYCLDVNNPDESSIIHLQDIVKVFSKTKNKKTRRLCVAFTKSDMLAHPAHPGNNGSKIFDDELPGGSESNRRQKLIVTSDRIIEYLDQTLGTGGTGGLKNVILGNGDQQRREGRYVGNFEVCTSVGVAKDDENQYRPNVQDADADSADVYERQQLWWSGVDRVFLRAHGAMSS